MKLLASIVLLCLLSYQPTTTVAIPPLRHQPHSPRHHSPAQTLPPFATRPSPSNNIHIRFVQSWPPIYCTDERVGITCYRKVQSKFYTHGLWTADSAGFSLENCKTKVYPDMLANKLESLLDARIVVKLQSNWPSIDTDYPDMDFWAYQWRKHGVCSAKTLPPERYFERGALLSKDLDLLNILSRSGIFPGTTLYTKDAIKTAIGKAHGEKTVFISCSRNSTGTYLREVYLCMDKYALKYIPCPANPTDKGCGFSPQSRILIPPF